MSEFTHENLTLVGRHLPDPNSGPFENAQQAQAAGHDTLNPVTGLYQFGVVIDGGFVPLITEKAGYVFDQIALGQKQAQAQAQTDAPQL